jgi:WD40 repeat protein
MVTPCEWLPYHCCVCVVFTCTQTGSVHIYDAISGEPCAVLSGAHDTCVRDVSWHPQLPVIASSRCVRVPHLWHCVSSREGFWRQRPTAHQRPPHAHSCWFFAD